MKLFLAAKSYRSWRIVATLGFVPAAVAYGQDQTVSGSLSVAGNVNVAGVVQSAYEYTGSVVFTDGWAANDWKEIVQFAPANAGASGLYEITISATRGSLAESSTYVAAIDHSNADVWREAGTINDNSYVGGARCFTVDVNGLYGGSRFRIRALRSSAMSGNPGANLAVSFKIRSIGQNTAWTTANGSGSGGVVSGFQSMAGMSYNLYMGNPYLGAGTLALSANAAGDVGIGTPSPAVKLDVIGNIRIVGRDGYNASGEQARLLFGDFSSDLDARAGILAEYDYGLKFGVSKNGGSGDFGANSLTAMVIKQETGNVGIGTTTPSARLEVNGDIALSSNFNGLHFLAAAGPGDMWLDVEPGTRTLRTRNWNISSPNVAATGFHTGNIFADGSIGVGTNAATERLHVFGGKLKIQSASNGYGWIYGEDTNHSIILRGDRDGASINATNYHQWGGTLAEGTKGHRFWTGGLLANQVERMRIADDGVYIAGNVGIGTASPAASLHVYKSDQPQVRLQSANRAWSILSNTAWGNNGFSIYDITADSNRLQIDAAGNVGINTIAPQAKLDVAGDARVSGDLTIAGTLTAGSYSFGTGATTFNGSIGIGSAPNIAGWGNNARVLSVVGSASAASGGVLELAADAANMTAGNYVGVIDFVAKSNTANRDIAQIQSELTGSTSGNTGGNLKFLTKADGGSTAERMRIDANGNVGIGTSTPGGAKLVVDDATVSVNNKLITVQSSHASQLTKGVIGFTSSIFSLQASNIAGSVYQNLTLQPDGGNVGIGITNPGTYKLAVNGTIHAKEVVVDQIGWADYVFDENYRNPPLSEVEQHIKEHKHLPGVPSAGEVAEKGVSVGQMQTLLLQKIEELTLHMIEQEKRIQKLESENAALRTAH